METSVSEHEQKKQELEIAKLEADIRGAKLDRYFRPFQLLTPILLAFGVYLLVQQPQIEEKGSSACIDQVRFVIDFSKDAENSAGRLRGVFESMPFQCESARVTADSILAERAAEVSLRDADAVINRGRDYLDLDLNAVSNANTLCALNEVVALGPLYERAQEVLSDLERSALQLERSMADTASEMLAEESTGRGAKWAQLRAEREELSSRLREVQVHISDRENELEKLGALVPLAITFCA